MARRSTSMTRSAGEAPRGGLVPSPRCSSRAKAPRHSTSSWSFEAKYRYSVPSATSARAATSRICTASYPPSVASCMAASSTRSRRAACRSVIVARIGVPLLKKRPARGTLPRVRTCCNFVLARARVGHGLRAPPGRRSAPSRGPLVARRAPSRDRPRAGRRRVRGAPLAPPMGGSTPTPCTS